MSKRIVVVISTSNYVSSVSYLQTPFLTYSLTNCGGTQIGINITINSYVWLIPSVVSYVSHGCFTLTFTFLFTFG